MPTLRLSSRKEGIPATTDGIRIAPDLLAALLGPRWPTRGTEVPAPRFESKLATLGSMPAYLATKRSSAHCLLLLRTTPHLFAQNWAKVCKITCTYP